MIHKWIWLDKLHQKLAQTLNQLTFLCRYREPKQIPLGLIIKTLAYSQRIQSLLKKYQNWSCIYNDETKVLQYIGNLRPNSTTLNASADVVKVTDHTRLWDAELTWYTLQVLLVRLAFMDWNIAWQFLVLAYLTLPFFEVLAIQAKFLKQSGFCDQFHLSHIKYF